MESQNSNVRRRRIATRVFTELDAFAKVPDSYQETTTSGGTVSIIVFLFIGVLVISEFMYYQDKVTTYQYEVDKGTDEKMQINVDMTVAMDCDDIGADVLDLSGTSIDTSANLKMEPAYFALSKNQANWWQLFRTIRSADDRYQTVNEVVEMLKVFGKAIPTYMPQKDEDEFLGKDKDACRIHGTLEVNKVAGNFHITAGKSIPHPRGHAHLSSLVSELSYNFSHRIDLLSFGEAHPGLINPLDGDLEVAEHAYELYQYYIKVVPTLMNTLEKKNFKTNQYSVTQRNREVNQFLGSSGVPGIFFKYDLTSISIVVKEERRDFSQFLIRLCGIIGGIFATSGMMHSLISFVTDFVLQRISDRKLKIKDSDAVFAIASLQGVRSASPSSTFVATNHKVVAGHASSSLLLPVSN